MSLTPTAPLHHSNNPVLEHANSDCLERLKSPTWRTCGAGLVKVDLAPGRHRLRDFNDLARCLLDVCNRAFSQPRDVPLG